MTRRQNLINRNGKNEDRKLISRKQIRDYEGLFRMVVYCISRKTRGIFKSRDLDIFDNHTFQAVVS